MIERFDTFTSSITQIYKSLQKIKNQEMTELDLKGIHVMCLFYLGLHPEGLTLTALSSMCEEDKAATSRTINDLHNRGYINIDEVKRYRSPLTLTDAGKAVSALVNIKINSAVTAGGDGLTDNEREVFYHCLGIVSANLKKYSENED